MLAAYSNGDLVSSMLSAWMLHGHGFPPPRQPPDVYLHSRCTSDTLAAPAGQNANIPRLVHTYQDACVSLLVSSSASGVVSHATSRVPVYPETLVLSGRRFPVSTMHHWLLVNMVSMQHIMAASPAEGGACPEHPQKCPGSAPTRFPLSSGV